MDSYRSSSTLTNALSRAPRGAKRLILEALAASGIEVNGSRPWDPQVHDERTWNRILAQGTVGLGESYMDGWWDVEALDEFLARAIRGATDQQLPTLGELWLWFKARLINMQTQRRSTRVGEVHYDVGDDLYRRMLDSRMMYSCGYWRAAPDLEAAQEAKIDLVCRKLGLQSGMKVLDIGCGWGGAAAYAAQRYGVSVVGVTISRNQAQAARQRCASLSVEIRYEDYRRVTGRFDRIYSIGMFEHVGARNHRPYMAKVRELLAPDGLSLLHTIGNRVTLRANDPWIEKYIFPNSLIPSRAQIARAVERLLVVEDWHDFGNDYERTLLAWSANVESAWPDLCATYSDRFHRMWHFYLMVSVASFRARRCQLWQIVMSPEGVTGHYEPIR